MPLNASQRQELRILVGASLDTIISEKSIPWLQRCIAPMTIKPEDFKTLFDENYLQSIIKHTGINLAIRSAWGSLSKWVSNQTTTFPQKSVTTLKKYANYNPFNLADLRQLELDCVKQEVEEEKSIFILRLRELYLDMTPADTYQYGSRYPRFSYRLGDGPLRGAGEIPLPGEIQQDIEDIVTERIELFEETAAEKLKAEKDAEKRSAAQKQQELQTAEDEKQKLLTQKQQEIQAAKNALEKSTRNTKDLLKKLEENRRSEIETKEQQLELAQKLSEKTKKQLADERTKTQKLKDKLQAKLADEDNHIKMAELQYQELEKAITDKQIFASVLHEKINERLLCIQQTIDKRTKLPILELNSKTIPEAMDLGRKYDADKKYDISFTIYRHIKNRGSIEANSKLATLILTGRVGSNDKILAKDLLEEAAQQNDIHAQYNLGMILEYGDGTAIDLEKALYWYELAAAQNDVGAQKRVPRVLNKITAKTSQANDIATENLFQQCQ